MSELHLVRLPVELREFTAWALRRRYLDTPTGDGRGRPRSAELGYALHAALTGLFGRQAPRPFAFPPLDQRERRRSEARKHDRSVLDVYGYAGVPVEALRTLAHLTDDELLTLIDWQGVRSRVMPSVWPTNVRLRFDVRACPVRRIMKPFATLGRKGLPAVTRGKGSEVDAFEVAAARANGGGDVVRDRIYIDWLAERFEARRGPSQAVALVPGSVRVESFRSVRMLRRPRGVNGRRSPQWLTRPDVSFSGLLDVADSEAFSVLLASGVGRHCGFGFGMLLLRPA